MAAYAKSALFFALFFCAWADAELDGNKLVNFHTSTTSGGGGHDQPGGRRDSPGEAREGGRTPRLRRGQRE